MKSGDIIYFILLVFFMILGFFNDSRKKKQQQKRLEEESRPFVDEGQEVMPEYPQEGRRHEKSRSMPPPVPAAHAGEGVHREFRSSSDLVAIHDEQSSHSSFAFDYDANSFYEKDPDFPDASDGAKEEVVKRSAHPLIKELGSDAGHEDLKKGLIYGEIIQRKY
jgi:hypothetical protein